METLRIQHQGAVARIDIDRPDVKNAFDERVIGELQTTFEELGDEVRVVVLGGTGDIFCAGADLGWMKRSAHFDEEQNVEDAKRMSKMFRVIDEAPQAVIARVNGAAFGGALGLMACCDIVIAEKGSKMAFSECKLGIIPAVISPFVVRKIGATWARRYFLTAEIFTSERAQLMGLVHDVVDPGELDAAVERVVHFALSCGPRAVSECKSLMRQLAGHWHDDDVYETTARTISRLRSSEEGQEGITAFLEKRKASWR